MNISDLSYLEVVADTIAIHGGLFGVSAQVTGSSTGGATSASAQAQVMTGTFSSGGYLTSATAEINISATGGDFTGNVAISGLEPTDQVVVTEGDNHLNIVINPVNEPVVFDLSSILLEFDSWLNSYNL